VKKKATVEIKKINSATCCKNRRCEIEYKIPRGKIIKAENMNII